MVLMTNGLAHYRLLPVLTRKALWLTVAVCANEIRIVTVTSVYTSFVELVSTPPLLPHYYLQTPCCFIHVFTTASFIHSRLAATRQH